MGTVSNILEALRRIGRPTEKTVLQRQDEQLVGQTVLSRRRRRIEDPLGVAESFIAHVEPSEETVTPLSEEELRPIRHNAALVARFLVSFNVSVGSEWRLEDLDLGFKAWLEASDKLGYSNEAVVEILGAAFGEHCANTLGMRWIRVQDKYGEALGLQGIRRDARGFPFHTVEKRIPVAEYGFLVPVYISLKHSLNSDEYRETV
jgi:hypothetical protein